MDQEKLYTKNPYGEEPPYWTEAEMCDSERQWNEEKNDRELAEKWQEAQERTSEEWIVLKKT